MSEPTDAQSADEPPSTAGEAAANPVAEAAPPSAAPMESPPPADTTGSSQPATATDSSPPTSATEGAQPAEAETAAPPSTRARLARTAAGALRVLAYGSVVVAAWFGLHFWGLELAPFHTKGEPREALVVWEMTHGGGLVLPRRNGDELPSKPPLFHWLGALTSHLAGRTDEWTIRLPSAALSLVGLLAVFGAGSALWSARAGAIAALALMTMFEWSRAATSARVDMTLTAGLEIAFLSLLFFLRGGSAGWLVPLYAGIAFAVLGKGPVGVVLPGLAALILMALRRDFSPLRRMRLVSGALVVLLLAGTWYVLAWWNGGDAFLRKQVLAENVFTFLKSARYRTSGHTHSAAYLGGALALGVLPWTLFFPGVLASIWRDRRAWHAGDARLQLAIWALVVFVFYSLSASKRGVYLLALYPALALLLGWWWDERCAAAPGDAEQRWLARIAGLVGWLLAIVVAPLLVVVGLQAAGLPVAGSIAEYLPPRARPFTAWVPGIVDAARLPLLASLSAALVGLYGLVRGARRARWGGIFAGMFVVAAAFTAAARLAVLPGVARHTTARDFMAAVRAAVGPDEPLCFRNVFSYGAVYYSATHIPKCAGNWPSTTPRYVVMDGDEWDRSAPAAAGVYEQVRFPADVGPHGRHRLVLLRRVGPPSEQ